MVGNGCVGTGLTSQAHPVCVQRYSWFLSDSLLADEDLDTCWSCTCCWPEAVKCTDTTHI